MFFCLSSLVFTSCLGNVIFVSVCIMAFSLHVEQAAVSDYMQQSNRPYSCINVFDNLRKKIPKGERITRNRPAIHFPSPFEICSL